MEDARIVHEKGRFYIPTPHGDAELLYDNKESGIMNIYHTLVPEGERGGGLAGKLAAAAFKYAREKGLKVRPSCTYIEYYVEKHPEVKAYTIDSTDPLPRICPVAGPAQDP